MANNAAYVSAGKPKLTGATWSAAIGSTLPTDATTALDSAFKCLGYSSENGLNVAITRTSETIKAWGGETVLTPQTEYEEKYSFTLIEPLNSEVLKVVYGDDNVVTTSTLRTVKSTAEELPKRSWVFDMTMSNGLARRIVIPFAKVTEIGDIAYVDNEPVGYELTLTATPDATGKCSYTYDELAAASGTSGNS